MSVSKWATSFYYQQDLRSYYMNNLLNASLNPGVYDADIALFASQREDTTSSSSSYVKKAGLNLYVKKGTTLLFSNNYKKNASGHAERDLDNIGTFLLKSTALEDIIYPIEKLEGNSALYFLGQGDVAEPLKIYVVARMSYSADNITNIEEPEFYLYVDNPNFEEDNYYFSEDGLSGTGARTLPDGIQDLKNETVSKQIAYLMLGVILPVEANKTYLNNKNWVSSGAATWNRKHVFVAEGLPDYRHFLARDVSEMTPDIILGIGDSKSSGFKVPKYDRILLDLRRSILNGRVVENTIDIKNIYCWGENAYSESSKLGVTIPPVDETNATTGTYVACDFVYLSSQLKDSDREDSLADVFVTERNCELKNFSWISTITDKEYDKLEVCSATIKDSLISVTEITGTEGNALDIKTFEDGLIPLDLSKTNQTRLLGLVKNKDILRAVINRIRHTDNNAETDTIVPVALILRAFKKDGNGNVTYIDDATSKTSFNPANILNLLNLQLGAHRINNLSNIIEPYSILPTLE